MLRNYSAGEKIIVGKVFTLTKYLVLSTISLSAHVYYNMHYIILYYTVVLYNVISITCISHIFSNTM